MALSKEKAHEILTTFAESVRKRQSIVFCVQCGSTSIDQNFIYQLRCYNCGNSLPWNGYRFSIARKQEINDVAQSLQMAMSDSFSDWHAELEQAAGFFMQAVVGDCANPSSTDLQRLKIIIDQWAKCRHQIDELIERRINEISV